MTTLTAQLDHVLFRFVEDITSDRFVNATRSGIVVSSSDTNQSNMARWAQVTQVGPDVREVKVGDYVLIEPGKWTNGFYVDDVRYWKTDEACIMLISDKPEATY